MTPEKLEYHRRWRAAYADKLREQGRQRYAANVVQRREKCRAWHASHAEQRRESQRTWKEAHRANRLLYGAKVRNRYPVSITEEWIQERLNLGVCEASGLPFEYSVGRHPFSASLDRKDNTLGYTPENTRVVCWIYNVATNEYTDADVLKLAEAMCTPPKK